MSSLFSAFKALKRSIKLRGGRNKDVVCIKGMTLLVDFDFVFPQACIFITFNKYTISIYLFISSGILKMHLLSMQMLFREKCLF